MFGDTGRISNARNSAYWRCLMFGKVERASPTPHSIRVLFRSSLAVRKLFEPTIFVVLGFSIFLAEHNDRTVMLSFFDVVLCRTRKFEYSSIWKCERVAFRNEARWQVIKNGIGGSSTVVRKALIFQER